MCKRIKVRVKKPKKVSEDLAYKVFYNGYVLTEYEVESEKAGTLYIYNVRYKGKIFFLVSGGMRILRCIAL